MRSHGYNSSVKVDNNFCNGGFTIIELVVVLVLIAIISAYAIPRLPISSFKETGFFQQAIATIRFGQKLAISSGCNVQVQISSTSCTLNWSGCAGNAAIPNPATGGNNFCSNSITSGTPAANFIYDKIGSPTTAVPQINFGGGRSITVEANTGYAHG